MNKLINLLKKIKYYLTKGNTIALSSQINKNTQLEGYNRLYPKCNVYNSYIGFGSYVGKNSFLPHTKVGKFCTIGPNVKLVRGRHPSNTFISIHPAFYSTRKQAGFSFVKNDKFDEFTKDKYALEIGNDVWIGSDVLILEGVKISDGAIIGSGAVVSKDIPPYTICYGNPIIFKKQRFSEKEIDELLKLKWWDKPIAELISKSDYFENIKNLQKLKDD